MKNITEVREAFWLAHPQFQGDRRSNKRQNDYKTDIRVAFCDWLDMVHRDGLISDEMAQKATL